MVSIIIGFSHDDNRIIKRIEMKDDFVLVLSEYQIMGGNIEGTFGDINII